MASADPLEYQIRCAVCYEVYQNPHILRECFHTFCLQCIDCVEQNGKVRCPECRTITDRIDIKKDFKLQGVLDALKQQEQLKMENSDAGNDADIGAGLATDASTNKDDLGNDSAICDMCHNKNKAVKYRCQECSFFICADCITVHKRMKVCETHTVKTSEEMVADISKHQQEAINMCEKVEKIMEQRFNEIAFNIDVIDQSEQRQLEDIDKFTEELIAQLRENQEKLKTDAKAANVNVVNSLAMKKRMIDDNKTEVRKITDFLKDITLSENMSSLTETSIKVSSVMKEDIIRLSASIPETKSNVQSPVHIRKRTNWDIGESIELQIDKTAAQFTQNDSAMFSNLLGSKFTMKTCHTINSIPNILCQVKGHVWCAEDNKIVVYNQASKPIQKIQHGSLQYMRGLAKTGQDTVWVACRHNKGLHELDLDGKYKRHVANGSFSDVCSYGGYVYALDYIKCTIMKFHYEGQKIVVDDEIILGFKGGSDWDKVVVHKNGIHVSSCKNRRIYGYNTANQLIDEIGYRRNNKILLTAVNDQGHLLVCDRTSSNILVYKDRLWHPLAISPPLKPMDVVVDDQGDLWVATFTAFWAEQKKVIYKFGVVKH